ncbi:hypothetical protein FE257_011908 [Aspergillus nanangensis]|uniref:RhoGAP domain protein n=1 Tax=Aspergillus nanangensis TaxID=2582783 RepID=A0AAD4CGT3_ASPNN|nr:hypothetical protein FE257_011908 [Aspergillus nanangensis]
MSQLRRQGSDHQNNFFINHNHNKNIGQVPFGSHPPSTPSSRYQNSAQPSFAGDLPRDHLNQQSAGQTLPSGVITSASPRNPIPFPLRTNVLPRSASPANSSPSQASLSPKSSAYASYQNHNTTTQIAHAAFPAPPSGTSQIPASAVGKRHPNLPDWNDRAINGRTTDNMSRQMSYKAELNQTATPSPISSPVNPSQPMPGERLVQRSMPRTSSIDSAISSLSSASQSHKSSFDANAVSQADIENLVTTAGSAEAVIIHLLKEKHHAASQNSQLWRLVDKQRTLILGLNKDLERAMKEKERYKKKVKELQTTVPPLPSMHEQAQHYGPSGREQVHSRTTPPRNPDGGDGSTISADKELSAALNESDQRFGHPAPQSLSYSRQELATASPTSLISSTSTNDIPAGEDGQRKMPQPMRKPPPAPLNLDTNQRTSIGKTDMYDSESEYEDMLEVDELPVRGRRKTRDDDDREREVALVTENGASETKLAKPSNTSVNPDIVSDKTFHTGPQAEFLASPLSPRITQGSPNNGHLISMAPKSPGLPLSPRPEDRPLGSPLPRMPRDMSHTLSSMPMSSGNNVSGLPLSPRVGKFQNPYIGASPPMGANTPSHAHGLIDYANRTIPSIDAAVKIDSPQSPGFGTHSIYQGLVSEDYPMLLLPPNALPVIRVKVASSRLRPSRNSYMASKPLEEEPVFTLSVFSRSEGMELWRVEKIIAALPQLDYQLRQLSAFPVRLPDRSIFSGHSPAKVDSRRAALNAYFEALLDTPMDEKTALVICQFLTADAIEPRDDETSLLKGGHQGNLELLRGPDGKPRKEGYLTKRGKNFGGWKARYFTLHGPELKYFESPGGAHLGTIKLQNAQIGKQSQNASGPNGSPSRAEDDTENQYRHAFLILEPKKKDSSALVRHVLCAESDEERDAWVEALLEYVEGQSENERSDSGHGHQPQASGKPDSALNYSPKTHPNGGKKTHKGHEMSDLEGSDTVQGFSFDDAVPAEPPVFGPPIDQQGPRSPMFAPGSSVDILDPNQGRSFSPDQAQVSSKLISGPSNGAVIQNAGAWGNKAATSTKEKKRSIWGFRTRSSYDLAAQLQPHNNDFTGNQIQSSTPGEKRDYVRPVFGIPLAEAVQFCAPQGADVALPAVVYRCIEYLKAKGAESEEGIFRLSGSNVVVKGLKERFNTEGDVDFLADDQYYDVHAVASLFKQYLRELPTSVLTRELHIEFLRVLELNEKEKKILAFNSLVYRLPKANLVLLRALVQFLMIIVNNSDVNKMTVRNVGIVFAPTLNIPAPVFSLFLTEFDGIFEHMPNSSANAVELTVDQTLSSDDIRSPRRQMFSDIPTPAYNQTTFRRHGDSYDDIDAHHETGFIPVQPSYEQSPSNGLYHQDQGMLSPNLESSRSAKAKRRESSLLFMELNHQTAQDATTQDVRRD